MKSLQKIQFLELHLFQMKHLLHHKLLQNKKNEKTTIPTAESTISLQLQMMSTTMRMK